MLSKRKQNIFTVDTEDWFHANYRDGLFENDISTIDTVERNTDALLEHFNKSHSTATFFVLGSIAEKHPILLHRISNEGHEIACHGYMH